jgi:hypothetical protein
MSTKTETLHDMSTKTETLHGMSTKTETLHGTCTKQKHCMACPLNRNTAWHRHQTETLHGQFDMAHAWSSSIYSIFCTVTFCLQKCIKTFFREGSWKRKLQEIYFITSPSVPRMYALFFHRLSILERATDHKCIKECSYSKRNVGRIKCNGPVIFSQRGGISSNTCVFPPGPPPPPYEGSEP